MRYICILILALVSCVSKGQNSDDIKEQRNATVLIYKSNKSATNLTAYGTGFFLYSYFPTNTGLGLPMITCKHLTYNDSLILAIPASDSIKNLLIRNQRNFFVIDNERGLSTRYDFDGTNLLYKIPLKLDSNLFRHQTLDLAIIFCFPPKIVGWSDGSKLELTKLGLIPRSLFASKDEIEPTTDVIFVGFPFGIGSSNGFFQAKIFDDVKVNAVFRKGIVSWVSETKDEFLIDGFSFGGNSGSPIFSKGNILYNKKPKFIGMVTGHLLDNLQASSIDPKTGKSTLLNSFTQPNNGLGTCIPASAIAKFADDMTELRRKNLKLN